MTNHSDPIDRALDRLTLGEAPRHTILTDLAAEIRVGAEKEIAEHKYWRSSACKYADKIEARLAAVVAHCNGVIDADDYDAPLALKILALARGEGGEQASGGVHATKGEAGLLGDARHSEAVSSPTRDPEPATPDAPQITMHAWEPDESGYECKHCGHMARAEVHGETGHQQSPASDGGLDEIESADLWPEWCELKNGELPRAHFVEFQGLYRRVLISAYQKGRIRARVTDPRLAAVRAWRDGLRLPPMPNDWAELDAILDGKED